jgi:hypothetical protein
MSILKGQGFMLMEFADGFVLNGGENNLRLMEILGMKEQ